MRIIKAVVKNTKVQNLYTIYFFDGTYVTLSIKNGKIFSDAADGCSFSDGELDLAANSKDLKVAKEEKLINFFALPFEIQKYVIRKINNSRTKK
jgi:hypothetical protein